MKINKLKALSVAVCCLAAALWSDAQCAESQKEATPMYNFKYEKEIITEYKDIVVEFNKNEPIFLMKKGYSTFEENHEVLECNGKTIVFSPPSKSYKYLLESKRFSVKEGQKINVLYNIEVRSEAIGIGILNTTRANWLTQKNLCLGEHKYGVFGIKVPSGETVASLVLFHRGNGESKNNNDFIINDIIFNIED